MRLLEHEGKNLLAEWGIAVPCGKMATSSAEMIAAVKEFGGSAVVKIQVPMGKRGKAGGVRVVKNAAEAEAFFRQWHHCVYEGYTVDSFLVEEALDITAELYMSLTLNALEANFCFIFSPSGGGDIEEVAARHPAKVVKIALPPINDQQHEARFRQTFAAQGFSGPVQDELVDIAARLYRGFMSRDALLAEINPLAVLKDGRVLALDAKIEIDDSALFRQKSLQRETPEGDEGEREGKEIGVTYIRISGGNVGIIASGAGLCMNTMDLLHKAGLEPANFLETGGGITSELIRRSLHLVTRDSSVQAVIINLYGGVNSLLEAAKGVVAGVGELQRPMPLVVKALGNQQEECWKLLEEMKIPVIKSHRTEDTVSYIRRRLEGIKP